MTEATDGTTTPPPPVTPPPKTRRPRKFSLPDHHHEEEHEDKIEAFLDGPTTRRRRSRHQRAHRRHMIALDTDSEWSMALRHESARQARYGRSMVILVIDLVRGPLTSGPDGLALRLAQTLGREVRETDRATRADPGRFLVLLPETNEDEAAHLASRIERGYRSHGDESTIPGDIRIEIAVPRRGEDPDHAVSSADRRLSESMALS